MLWVLLLYGHYQIIQFYFFSAGTIFRRQNLASIHALLNKLSPAIFYYITLKNIGSLEGTIEYYYHSTPEEPLQGSAGVAW